MHFNYFRMLQRTKLFGPSLIGKTANSQEPLSPSLRLAVALQYLATGESQNYLRIKRINKKNHFPMLNNSKQRYCEFSSKPPPQETDYNKAKLEGGLRGSNLKGSLFKLGAY